MLRGWGKSRRVGVARMGAAALAALVTTALAPLVSAPTAAAAADPCGPGGNEIACENSKPGTPRSEWDDFYGAGAESLQGYATSMSVEAGERVDFKIDTNASAYSIEIFRTGWYGGDGARRITTIQPSARLPQSQPSCITDAATELYDCGNWAVSASWQVPTSAVSGVYLARLHRADTDESSHIIFIVRDDDGASDLVFQTSDTTWQAYNDYGGSNYYWGGANGRAYKVSYNRPITTRGDVDWGRDFYFANEYPMVRFLERNGYDVSYISGLDTATRPGLLHSHKTYLSVGHDEYWTGPQRSNVEAARDAGVNLMFLSGNEMYWRSRLEPSIDGTNTPNRTLVTYKETWANRKIDPSPEWTGTFRDPRFASPADGGGVPENALTGTMYMVNHDDLTLTVKAEEGKYRLWRNTDLASMSPGTTKALAPHTIGYESNEDMDNGFRPAGLVRLSTTIGPTPQYVTEYGNKVDPGETTHHLTLYRAASGAQVFSAGTVQWTWGLDDEHDTFAAAPTDRRMQQAQVNLLADFGAQPTTLMNSLVGASPSTDVVGPSVTISTPTQGEARANGTRQTVTGTATDSGGRVAGVEVSTDEGRTWHPAEGTTSWSYSYIQQGQGNRTVRVRATDDSANTGTQATRGITVACPCSVFGAEVPAIPAADDGGAVELGLRFEPEVDGFVSGVRFYKGTGNTGTHEGSLWSADGERLGQVTFTDETETGWQKALFENAVPVEAGKTYVVSYSAPNGRYSYQSLAFADRGIDATPLKVRGGWGEQMPGVYGGMGGFPRSSHNWANYYVDALFTTVDESPLTVSARTPIAGSSSVLPDTVIGATFSKRLTPGSAQIQVAAGGQPVAGTTAYDEATRRITFTPSQPLAPDTVHSVTVTGLDELGGPVTKGGSWTFRSAQLPGVAGQCPCMLLDDTDRPAIEHVDDRVAVTLGVRFASSRDAFVTGMRFYKGVDNTGTHTGSLWGPDGRELATGTFTDESTTGWQTLVFTEPVRIDKLKDYIVSYRAPKGLYPATLGAFSSADLSREPIRVTYNSGAYTYGTGFPGATSSTNYFVTPILDSAPPVVTVAMARPADGATDVPRWSEFGAWFSAPIESGWSLSMTVGGNPVAGTTRLGTTGASVHLAPDQPLPRNALVTVTLSGVVSVEGAVLPTQTFTFRTADSDDVTGPQTLLGNLLPQTASTDDSSAIELGLAFTAGVDGQATGIRFHKGGPDNGGIHTGSLWTADGQLLSQVEFADETPSGWQRASLGTPVQLTAGTTYVVSYYAPRGHYSSTPGWFDQPRTSGDLTAVPGTNGRYLYGAGGGFPTSTYGAANYFVDVEFRAGTEPAPPPPAPAPEPAPEPAPGPAPEPAPAPAPEVLRAGLFDDQVPSVAQSSSTRSIEVGTHFTTSVEGEVTAIKFWKGTNNTGRHVVSLWRADGTRLLRQTVSNETASGWQTVALSPPQALQPGAYVVSYLAPRGRVSSTPDWVTAATPRTAGPLTAARAQNGRYRYTSGGAFPNRVDAGTGYFVDVDFRYLGP